MQDSSALQLWGIGIYLVVVVAVNLLVDIIVIEILPLSRFDKDQIKEIHKALFKIC